VSLGASVHFLRGKSVLATWGRINGRAQALGFWIVSLGETLDILARKIRRNLGDYGWWITAKKGVAHLFQPVFLNRTYRIHRVSLEKVRREPDRASDCVFTVLKPEDSWAIEQIEYWAEWLQGKLRNRVAAGDLCYVALKGREVVAFNLIAFGALISPLGTKRRFRPHQAWSDHVSVLPGYRRKGLVTQLRYKVFEELRKRGIRQLYAGALPHNVASLRSAGKVGFCDLAKVRYLKILGFRTRRYVRVRGRRRTGT